MTKHIWKVIAIGLVVTLTMFGTGYAGWFGDDKPESETEEAPASEAPSESQNPAAAPVEILPESDHMTVSGTINENNQLINEEGETFELADTDKGMEVRSLIGKKVEVKGTVLEEEGLKTIEVHDYKTLEE